MKLAAKFALTFLVVMTVVLSLNGYTVVEREEDLFVSDMKQDDRLIGEVFAAILRQAWQYSGEAEVLDLVRKADKSERHVRIRWTWLEAPSGSPFAPRVGRDQLEPLLQGSECTQLEISVKGIEYLFTYLPVVHHNGRSGVLELSESMAQRNQYTRTTIRRTAALTGTMILLSAGFASLIGFWFVGRPARRLAESTRRVASGDFSARLNIHQHDELGQLAREVDIMCERLAEAHARISAENSGRIQALEQLRHSDRLRTVGQLTSGIAHELGTPLNVVWARAKMIAGGEVSGQETKDCANIIVEQSARITKIIRQLLDFARPRSPMKTQLDLLQIVRQTISLLEPTARKGNVSMTVATRTGPIFVQADGDQLQQVLSNLILNAIQAMPKGGTLTIGTEIRRIRPPADQGGDEADFIALWVGDEGVGIPIDDIPRVFDPFFTTKEVGEGTGLGLSVALGMIKEHGGWIDVDSKPKQGTCFTVYLPTG